MQNQDTPQNGRSTVGQLSTTIRGGSALHAHLTDANAKPPTDWWGMGKREAFQAIIKNAIDWGFEVLSSMRRKAA